MESAFQLKGKLFTLSVLQLQSTNLSEIEQELQQKVQLAPKFFNNTPVVVDLHEVDKQLNQLDLNALKKILEKHTLIIVGFRGQSEAAQKAVTSLGLPLIKEARATAQPRNENQEEIKTPQKSKNNAPEIKKENTLPSKSGSGTVVIEQQVRSGQQIYAPDGDLIVLASVSPGAELLAEGNIHVYGTLRGRALAGLNGDTDARIFCQKLEADLVSIAGQYKLFEESLTGSDTGQNKQIHLKNGQLVITNL